MLDLTIAVVGSVLADITVRTPRLPHSGENLYVEEVATSPGGKGSNAAVTLARHGATVYLISNVGTDAAGEQIRAALAAEGVEVAGLGSEAEIATGAVVMIAEASGETCYLVFPGASRSPTGADVAGRLAPLLRELDAIYLNLEAPEAALLAAADIAHRHALPLYIDAGPERPMSPELWAHAALLSPNAAEAAVHTGLSVTGRESAEQAARVLLAQGPALVAVKLGAQGVLLVDRSGSAHVPAFSIPVVDPAGAGDAFTAGFTWALLQGESPVAAARWANACGALVTTRLGTVPAMPSHDEVSAFLEANPPLAPHAGAWRATATRGR